MVCWQQWAVFPVPTCVCACTAFNFLFPSPTKWCESLSNNKQKEMIFFSYKTQLEVTSWAASALIRWLETKTRTVSITAPLVGSLVMCQVTWWLKSLWTTSTWSICSCSRDSSLSTTQVRGFIIYSAVCRNCSGSWMSWLEVSLNHLKLKCCTECSCLRYFLLFSEESLQL